MLSNLRLLYRLSMDPLTTQFVDYKVGGPEGMFISERQINVEEGERLMKVKAIGINRAECLHRQGKYKIGKPVEAFLGLEAAGEVYDPVSKQKLYDGIALLSGGSYSRWASIPSSHIMPLPKGLNFVQGAAIPQAWLTAFQLLRLAQVKAGDSVVVYAAASGVGTAAIQLGRLLGATVWGVVSTEEKGKICLQLGASGVVYYKDNAGWAKQLIQKKGGNFSAVLDCVGSDNCDSTLELLGLDGKWILFGLLSGFKTNLNLASLLAKRIQLISTTLKTRSNQYKDNLISDFTNTALSGFEDGRLKPIIFQKFTSDWSSPTAFIQAHKLMESNANFGKIMIEYL